MDENYKKKLRNFQVSNFIRHTAKLNRRGDFKLGQIFFSKTERGSELMSYILRGNRTHLNKLFVLHNAWAYPHFYRAKQK